MKKYKKHIVHLCNQNGIKLLFDVKELRSSYAMSWKKEIHLKDVLSESQYAIALHEIGHVVNETREWMEENQHWAWLRRNGVAASTRKRMKWELNVWRTGRNMAKYWTPGMHKTFVKAMKIWMRHWEYGWESILTNKREFLTL